MQVTKEDYVTKRIYDKINDCSVRIANSVTWDNYSASLGMPGDAKQLPS